MEDNYLYYVKSSSYNYTYICRSMDDALEMVRLENGGEIVKVNKDDYNKTNFSIKKVTNLYNTLGISDKIQFANNIIHNCSTDVLEKELNRRKK